jgi:hypothetical protein
MFIYEPDKNEIRMDRLLYSLMVEFELILEKLYLFNFDDLDQDRIAHWSEDWSYLYWRR